MGEVSVTVSGVCGWKETVSEPQNGQSLGGTAGDIAARHQGQCGKCTRGNPGIRFDWSSSR